MAKQPWKNEGMTKADWVAREVARSVNAGKEWNLATVDFADPLRPLTCLEVDFPIIPVNQIAAIEGNAGKPIYQMSKWWARRRSSVFRSMLIAAATKAPDDPAEAAKTVWDAYYGNHQAKSAFKHLKVADIFMGGGTTVVEGSRLGMQMFGNDLNPVAWFVVKNEMAKVDRVAVEELLAEIEREVKPQIMPFYTCDCPRGHKGKWTRLSDGQIMGDDFDATALTPEERKGFRYEGAEIIYVFWAKHGPCQVTGCGHRTPIMTSPVMAVKTLSVKTWTRQCQHCKQIYDLEERDARMAPGVPLVVAETESPFAVATLCLSNKGSLIPASALCPFCKQLDDFGTFGKSLQGKAKNKKIDLTLLVHPDWLRGDAPKDSQGRSYGGSADDDVESTVRWNNARAAKCRLLEVRGKLPEELTCPETGVTFNTGKEGGTVPGRSRFACGACGATSDIREAIAATGKNGPVAMYAVQGYCPECAAEGHAYNGRFFVRMNDVANFNAALKEWAKRKDADLALYWPKSEVPYGFMTAIANGDIRTAHGFTHWWKMFNPRQLLANASLLKSIADAKNINTAEFVLGIFQPYLRNQCMFAFWHMNRDHFAPAMSNSNYHPKDSSIEVGTFSNAGYGPWPSSIGCIPETINWLAKPWELAHNERLVATNPLLDGAVKGKSEKVLCGDPIQDNAILACCSSTELTAIENSTYDMVITDPPFGGLLHYSELADFFYVWLRLVLKDRYPEQFTAEYTPKALEAVANKARQDDPDAFYQRLLTECWREAHRILKPGGLLAFTFHHSEDAPWVAVLESLFDAGFYLQATYPIRSDETKGDGQFGSKKIEYDIIHVCRKRTETPTPTSWARLRRQILSDVRELQDLLERHSQEGLPEADQQVIRRGKALEYFSRHYGQVFKEPGSSMTVIEALVGVNQLLDEDGGATAELPPSNAEPFTRMLLRLFDGTTELPRDQIQKFLRGTGCSPSDFLEREWVSEQSKVFSLIPAFDMARGWIGKMRKTMTSDYDQAMFFIGACHEGSGINANDTLNNDNFKPHPALGALLQWFCKHGGDVRTRKAAAIASQLYQTWEARNAFKMEQLFLDFTDGKGR
jgi:putative DNA methylase